MTDRDGERVGRVVRRRHRGEAEQQLDHLLHLLLLGAAVADHRALDLGRRVLDDRQTPASTAASIATPRACPSLSALRDVDGMKQVLDGDAVAAGTRASSAASRL